MQNNIFSIIYICKQTILNAIAIFVCLINIMYQDIMKKLENMCKSYFNRVSNKPNILFNFSQQQFAPKFLCAKVK